MCSRTPTCTDTLHKAQAHMHGGTCYPRDMNPCTHTRVHVHITHTCAHTESSEKTLVGEPPASLSPFPACGPVEGVVPRAGQRPQAEDLGALQDCLYWPTPRPSPLLPRASGHTCLATAALPSRTGQGWGWGRPGSPLLPNTGYRPRASRAGRAGEAT